jgi:hypothetical protein
VLQLGAHSLVDLGLADDQHPMGCVPYCIVVVVINSVASLRQADHPHSDDSDHSSESIMLDEVVMLHDNVLLVIELFCR